VSLDSVKNSSLKQLSIKKSWHIVNLIRKSDNFICVHKVLDLNAIVLISDCELEVVLQHIIQ
jgi:hypothetical protein